MKPHLVLGIETSCDETACALVRDRQVLASVVASQDELHRDYGGVVPEIASRAHLERLPAVLEETLGRSGETRPDAVAVTTGPGLIGSLLVGVSFAQGLARAWDVPLVPVHHLHAHLWGVAAGRVEPAFCGVVVSGGHTAFYLWRQGETRPRFLGGTVDDAAGEAFDKVAALLGLGYPGGPAVERAARRGEDRVDLPLAGAEMPGLSLSFSGLKTAVLYHLRRMGRPPSEEEKADIAASFQARVARTIALKTARMLEETGVHKVVVGGGVAANTAVREALAATCRQHRAEVFFPPAGMAQDNGAMVALCGAMLLASGGAGQETTLCPEPFSRGKERLLAKYR